jgi:SP family sugar:H+ symporter-like MFS transporter
MLLGCAAGALSAGNIADKMGRRPVMVIAGFFFFISALGSGLATNAPVFIVFRVLGGLAVGAASVIAPAYIAEVAPAKIRGRLASLQQLAIVVGIFVAFISNYVIARLAGSSSSPFLFGFDAWKWMFWMEGLPAAAYFLLALIIPESPRYLVANNDEAGARDVLAKVFGGDGLEHKIEAIKHTVNTQRKPRFTDIFSHGRILPIVVVGIFLSIFQQFVGINVVFYYGAVLWEAAGFSENASLFINVVSGTINILSTIAAICLIDRIGRKPLLLGGSAGMVLTLGTMSFVFTLAEVSASGQLHLTRGEAISALLAAHFYIFFFGVSWGPVVWVMLGEMFNNRIRGAAISTAAAAQWVANFLVTMTFPIILAGIGLFGAYGLYALCAFLSIIFVAKFVKETKGKTLEEME